MVPFWLDVDGRSSKAQPIEFQLFCFKKKAIEVSHNIHFVWYTLPWKKNYLKNNQTQKFLHYLKIIGGFEMFLNYVGRNI
jgi:hypothetical protein